MTRSGATRNLELLFVDDHLAVVAKPPRLLVVPAPGRERGTLVDRLGTQLGGRVHAVHRLDEDTTGALCVARTEAARDALERIFREHLAARTYLALVARVPQPRAGRIESRLEVGRDGVVRSTTQRGRGERAVTSYRFLERRGRHALLACELETGRRNQIRAHLAELGAPIVGDRKYGWRPGATAPRPKRPLLHAWRLAFDHPLRELRVDVRCAALEPELAAPARLE